MGRILDNPQFSGAIQFTAGTFTALAGTTVDFSAATVKLPAGALAGVTIPLMTGDGAGNGGTAGAVPAPPAGSAAGGTFLNAYGQWSVPAANLPAGSSLVVSPMTTALDMIVGGANGAATRLAAPAAGTAGTMALQWTSAGGIVWAAQAASGGGGGGIAEAPQDGILYGREDGAWTQIPGGGGSSSGGSSSGVLTYTVLETALVLPAAGQNVWQDVPGLTVTANVLAQGNVVRLAASIHLSNATAGTNSTARIVRSDGTIIAQGANPQAGQIASQTATYWDQEDAGQGTQFAWFAYDTPPAGQVTYKVQAATAYPNSGGAVAINRTGSDRAGVDARGVSTLEAITFGS